MKKLPSWLQIQIPQKGFFNTTKLLKEFNLPTVCESAKCPNRAECFAKKRATFLALGNHCTRNCRFCSIPHQKSPSPPDRAEPEKIAELTKRLKLKHVVITQVTRDDLPDQGASHMAEIIKAVKQKTPDVKVEVLTSDFSGKKNLLDLVLNENPDIFNHNLETVERLSSEIRSIAEYRRSLNLLSYAKNRKPCLIKSGFMVGLGETDDEIKQTLYDLFQAGTDIVTIGQYLQPTSQQIEVKNFIPPKKFKEYEEYGKSLGIKKVFSGPFVRSSYLAEEISSSTIFSKEEPS